MIRFRVYFEGEPRPMILFGRSLAGVTERAKKIACIKRRKLLEVVQD